MRGASTMPAGSARLALAALVAPLAAPLAIYPVFGVANLLGIKPFASGGNVHWTSKASSIWLAVALIAYAITLVAGIPLTIRLRRRARATIGRVTLVGVVLGATPFVVTYVLMLVAPGVSALLYPQDTPAFARAVRGLLDGAPIGLVWLCSGMLCGGLVSALFALIALASTGPQTAPQPRS
jgi:hypothetical protein